MMHLLHEKRMKKRKMKMIANCLFACLFVCLSVQKKILNMHCYYVKYKITSLPLQMK